MKAPSAFVFPGLPSRVIFGPGSIGRVGEEVERLGHGRAFVLTTSHQAEDGQKLLAALGRSGAGAFAEAAMHTPVDVTERAVEAYRAAGADCVVALGGGSTIGLGKAIALRTGADQVVVPTTYAGSEMTDILGETRDGEKTTRRDAAILPETVIYDVDLTLSLPATLTVTSGLNALAHACEALYAVDRNPVIGLMAAEAVRAMTAALPVLANAPEDREARELAQYGAWLCGAALGGSSMALHHKLCHVLGGSFGLPHAETHAVMLPHTVGFNAEAAGDALTPLAQALDDTPGRGLHAFASKLGAPLRLADLGLAETDLDKAATIATKAPYPNPRPFDRDQIRRLLGNAFHGARPPH